MLSEAFVIKVNESFNITDIIDLLEIISRDKKLVFCIDSILEWYTDRDDNDAGVLLINKLKSGNLKRFILTKTQIKKLKKETSGNLNFSRSICYEVESKVDIELSVKLDHFWFYAFIIEDNKITHVLQYTESTDFMILLIDHEPESNVREIVKEYGQKYGKLIEGI